MDEETEPVYKHVEETGLPDWGQYNFLTPQDAVEWAILQGGIIMATSFAASFVMMAGEEDLEDPDFLEILEDNHTEVTIMVEQARAWWKERER